MSIPSVFGGRWDELHLLSQCRSQVIAGRPQFILIEGESGIGKSALLRAFADTRQPYGEPIRVFSIHPPAEGAYDPLHEAALRITNKRLYDRVGGKKEAKDLLFDWLGVIPSVGELLSAVSATADALYHRRRKRSASPVSADDDIVALIEAARRPVALLLDDLHLADKPAISRLEALMRTAGDGARLLLIGAYRSAAPGSPDPPIRAMLETLPPGLVRRQKLRSLTPKELEIWLGKVFPRAVKASAFVDWLFNCTGGHPATVQRTLNHLLQQSVIRFINRHWEIDSDPDRLDLPQVAESIADLSGISPAVAEVLRAASVLGEEFDSASLSRMLDRDELYVEDQLALGVHHDLLTVKGEIDLPDGDIATVYRFATSQLRAALYHGLPAEYRAQLEDRARAETALR